ncbi:polysaccharide deacetylase family protein [Ruminococcaceae bacterium OttesenSCG-928-L11]|nr:polysaccharide deacetylase family protein [Ruminococcaceae bacterium OttesenSCG-928-L11]
MRYGVFRLHSHRIAVTAVLLAAVITGLTMFYSESILVAGKPRALPIYSVETSEKKVAMGFNCAWDNADIPQLIRIFNTYGIRGTFFVSGSWCNKFPESVKALHDAGHEIGSHSNTHADMTQMNREEVLEQITRCNQKIRDITGTSATLFRMPSGAYNDLVIETIRSQGMEAIQWDCDSIDYQNPTPEEMKARIIGKLQNGSILLFHSGAQNTPAALPGIIEAIQAQGYEIVPVSELILPAPYTIDHEGRQHSENPR